MRKKRKIGLVLTALLLLGSAVPVQAVERQGKDGWKAEFTGKEIESNFGLQDFADEISDLEPSDSIRIRVAVKNSSKKGTDWYMSNQVLESLEDASPAQGGAYWYELSYEGSGDPVLLYSSDRVGGVVVSEAGEGLHEASDGLKEFFYLDHLAAGSEGYITLVVGLDGESQTGAYQETLARLRLRFAVEETAGNGGGGGGNSSTPSSPGSVIYSPGAVQTGDPGGLILWSLIALTCGILLLVCAVVSFRRARKESEWI